MPIIVTGAAGFIGYHLCQSLLARGEQVIGLDNLNNYYDVGLKKARLAQLADQSNFRFETVDIADMASLKKALSGTKPRLMVHLAAQAGVRYSLDNPAAYISSNLAGHANILEICRHSASLDHLVYASSSSVYGGQATQPFSESGRTDFPVSLYAATKKADELMSETYAHLYGLPQTGLRFFTVYGPWGRPDMAYFKFTKAIVEGVAIDVYNEGNMARDFTYIDDIVAGIEAVSSKAPAADQTPKPGGSISPHAIYNIGNNRPEKLGIFIAVLEDLLGKNANKIMKPMQPGDVKETFADISAIQKDFGFKPTTNLRQGLEKFITWYGDYYGL